MRRKKGAALDAGGVRGGAENYDAFYYSTESGKNQFPILNMLGYGVGEVITTRELMERTGWNLCQLRQQVARERANGALILSTCAGSGGYFRPSREDPREDLQRFIATLDRRARATEWALKGARAALAVMEGQTSLEMEA